MPHEWIKSREPIRITWYTVGMHTSLRPTRTRARTPNHRTTTGCRIADALWAVLAPLLPGWVQTHRFGGGRPRVPARGGAEAMFSGLRTGGPWAALPPTEWCATSTADDRFQAWVAAEGVWNRWKAGVAQVDDGHGRDWTGLNLDGAMTTAPLGGEKHRAPADRSGQRRGQAPRGDGGPRRAPGVGGGGRPPA
jgi:transposase